MVGGAARAAFRLHSSLLEKGVDSRLLVQKKVTDSNSVITSHGKPISKVRKVFNVLRPYLDLLPVYLYPDRSHTLFSPSWLPFSDLVKTINAYQPDIVHLHWVTAGMLPIEDIAKISAPVVWSLHDMWAFTGGCHYDEFCGRYMSQCGACPVLGSKKEVDLSRFVFNRKKKAVGIKSNLTIVGLSRWIADCASQSRIFAGRKVVNLPNPIDCSVYSPVEKNLARSMLRLPPEKKLIMFGAMNASGDPRKGFEKLAEAIKSLNRDDVELVVFGCSEPSGGEVFQQRVRYLGQLNDDLSLRVLYSAADVMVVPSIQENLSNAIMESLACGTPVVAFKAGGNQDMIDHQINGYLAEAYDAADLGRGIEWVLDHSETYELSKNAVDKVNSEFDSNIVAQRYIDLYQSILQG